jgi:hypothetical protein
MTVAEAASAGPGVLHGHADVNAVVDVDAGTGTDTGTDTDTDTDMETDTDTDTGTDTEMGSATDLWTPWNPTGSPPLLWNCGLGPVFFPP